MAVPPASDRGAVRVDKRIERGDRRREAILQSAMRIASVDGLEGLSIGRLADELKMSKSGVVAHFGSKEDLQLAAIQAAAQIFAAEVVLPAFTGPPGFRRVEQLCLGWIDYAKRLVFPGGCFFCQVSAEFDARPGRVHDAIAAAYRAWIRQLERSIEQARELGEMAAGVEATQLAFELDALVKGANNRGVLEADDSAYELARAAINARLAGVAVGPHRSSAV
jgi:AcrR family transcriptional regulator